MRTSALGLLVLVFAASARPEPTIVNAAVPEGCSTRLTATQAHPFLAEFNRQIAVTCGDRTITLDLQRDPGGLGRVELVQTGPGDLAVTDAFQSAAIRTRELALANAGLHEGKIDRHESPCGRTQVFSRAQGTFLGAFDYCDHQWQFIRPLKNGA